jgi:ribosomal-protein-alanine N-acetyltransferase
MSKTVRRARLEDLLPIRALRQSACRTLPQIWQWEQHLVDDLFVVVERDGSVAGALFAWPDGSPVAWVRMAVLDDAMDAREWLSLALLPVIAGLHRRKVHSLAWLDYGGWAGPSLQLYGFRRLNEVITLIKRDRVLPGAADFTVVVRPAVDADVASILAVDRAAFTPHWWNGEETIRRLVGSSSHLAVAEVAGEVVGYAEGALRLPVAHLNRIAVHPARQGCNIGSLLLRDALRSLWWLGAGHVTLNTQSDNHRSRQLYRRFGFEATGESMTAWNLALNGRTG